MNKAAYYAFLFSEPMIPCQNYIHQFSMYKINVFLMLLMFCFFAGYGRFKNPDYRVFLALLEETRLNNNEENKVNINA